MNGGLQIGYITFVDMANMNASFGGMNVIVIKKIKTPKGEEYPYVSGQMLRYIYRDKLQELGYELSKVEQTGETQGEPDKYIDDDIFGFMITERKTKQKKKGGQITRVSPIKVSAMIGLYPLLGNKDLLTRYPIDRKTKEKLNEPSLVEQEFTGMNYFKGCILIDLDRIGVEKELELDLGEEEKKKRVKAFLDAFRLKFGGGRQARMLSDITPKFIVGIKQKYKVPYVLDALKMDNDGNIELEPLITVLTQYKDINDNVIIGIRTGIFKNEKEVKDKLKDYTIVDSNEAINKMKEWV